MIISLTFLFIWLSILFAKMIFYFGMHYRTENIVMKIKLNLFALIPKRSFFV